MVTRIDVVGSPDLNHDTWPETMAALPRQRPLLACKVARAAESLGVSSISSFDLDRPGVSGCCCSGFD